MGRVEEPLGRSGSQGTSLRSESSWETLAEVRDRSGEPRKYVDWVGNPHKDLGRVGGSEMGRWSLLEVWNGSGDPI